MKRLKTEADQAALVSTCREGIENIGKITLSALSVAILFASAKVGAHWPVKLGSLEISSKWAYTVCGSILFFASFAAFTQAYKISKLIPAMTTDSRKQLSVDTSFWNFLADFGPHPAERLLSCQALAILIVAFWSCYAAVALLNPYQWDQGFELMMIGASTLFLCSVRVSKDAIQKDCLNRGEWFRKLPLIGRVTIDDIVLICAVGIGGSIALFAWAIGPRLAH